MADDGPIKFPTKTPPDPALSLRRRPGSPLEVSEASSAARASIHAIVAKTRTPWGESPGLDSERVGELERSLRQLEMILAERERVLAEAGARLAERERDVAESEALLQAREQLWQLARKQEPAAPGLSHEARAALEKLKAELEKQEAALKEAKQQLRERESFLEESENTLFEKAQAQQERETELEQRAENLKAKDRRLREREAAIDPVAAEVLRTEQASARKFDEFKE